MGGCDGAFAVKNLLAEEAGNLLLDGFELDIKFVGETPLFNQLSKLFVSDTVVYIGDEGMEGGLVGTEGRLLVRSVSVQLGRDFQDITILNPGAVEHSFIGLYRCFKCRKKLRNDIYLLRRLITLIL